VFVLRPSADDLAFSAFEKVRVPSKISSSPSQEGPEELEHSQPCAFMASIMLEWHSASEEIYPTPDKNNSLTKGLAPRRRINQY
jgi:hypothetical protein